MAGTKLVTATVVTVIATGTAIAVLMALMPGKTYSHPGVPEELSPLPTLQAQMDSDRQVLFDLYYATGGTRWDDRGYWLSSEPIGRWEGVTVEGGRVTRLGLGRNRLSGSIPPELGNLTHLTHLYLSDNNLSGNIPPELGNLTHLTHLYLSDNNLSGNIPLELGNLTNLTHLYLYQNNLSGNIPPELGNLTNLTHLYLYQNNLSGNIPPELANLTNIQRMTLSNPGLSGCIPLSLRYLPGTDVSQIALNLPFCDAPVPTATPRSAPTPTLTHVPKPATTPGPSTISAPTSAGRVTPLPSAAQSTALPESTTVPTGQPTVNFHLSETEVTTGEPVTLTLSVTNSIITPEMTLQLILQLPSGLSISGAGLGESCSVQCSTIYKVPSGENRQFELEAIANQPGAFNIDGRMEWLFGDDPTTHAGKDASLILNVLEPVPTPTPPPTPTPTPEPTTPPEAEPSVKLQADKFEVKVGEPVVLNLSAVNTIAKPEMTLQFILQVPSGWSMSGAGLTDACSGQCVATYKLAPGELKSTFLHMLPNQIGSFDAKGRITWYFGDDTQILYGESVSLELTVTESSTLAPPPAPTSTPTPRVAPTVAFAPATPPVNSGGGCGFTEDSRKLGDAGLLALPVLGLAGLLLRRRNA